MTAFAELVAATNFSFLRGAAHAHEMVGQAAELGLDAIGIADRNTLAGVVRAHRAGKEHKIRCLAGARLVPGAEAGASTTDGFEAVCYPTDRAAYGRLCRLLTAGNRRAIKGQCEFTFEEMVAASEGQISHRHPAAATHAGFQRAPARARCCRAGPHLSRRGVRLSTVTSAGASASWPRSRARCAHRSSPPTTSSITIPIASRWPTCSPASARSALFFTPATASRPTPSGT